MSHTVEHGTISRCAAADVVGAPARRSATQHAAPLLRPSPKVLPSAGLLACQISCTWDHGWCSPLGPHKLQGHAVAGRLPAELIGAGQQLSRQVSEDHPAGRQPAGVPA